MATVIRYKWFLGLNIENGIREVFQAPCDKVNGIHDGPWSEETGKYKALIGPFRTKRGAVFMKDCHNSPICQTVADAERLVKMDSDPMPGRVDRGARTLDRERPGWYRRIDKKKLEMSTCQHCVLGQLFDGDFTAGLNELGAYNESERFGFDVCPKDRILDYVRDNKFARLKRLWIREIDKRLKQEKS